MSDTIFSYFNTFKDKYLNQELHAVEDKKFTDVAQCEEEAINNKSIFFALTNFNEDSGQAYCLLPKTNESVKKTAELINGAEICKEYANPDGCSFTNNGNNFGLRDNLAVYTSPKLTVNLFENNNINIIRRESIKEYINEARTALSEFLDSRQKYLHFYFLNVELIEGSDITGIDRFFRGEDRERFIELKTNMESSQKTLENRMNDLNNNFDELLNTTKGFNENFSIYNRLIEIINSKIIIAEKFFNVLMSKNQGAIGELDLTEYNRNLSIFENVVLSIIMSTALYLYFKK